MGQLQTLIDPNSTSKMLSDLGLAIDEARLLKVINQLSRQINSIESSSGKSARTRYLLNQIETLNIQLDLVREQANQQMSY